MATWLEGNGTTDVADTPDSAALSITGDIDLRFLVAPDSVTVEYFMIAKRDAGREWAVMITATGVIALEWTTVGAVNEFQASNVPHGWVAGEWNAGRATLDIDNGAGAHVVTFEEGTGTIGPGTDLSAVSWSQLSQHTRATGATTIAGANSNTVQLGARGATNAERQLDGKLAKAQIRNGIAGTVVGSPDFTALPGGATSYTDGQGNVWTFGSGVTIGSDAVQFARPVSDTSVGAWVTDTGASTNLFAAIDETTASDTDYIRSPTDPVNAPVAVKLGTITDPVSSAGHVVRYRYLKSGTATIDLTVELRQGYVSEGNVGTLIASATQTNISTTATTGTLTLSGAEADAITNYTDLHLRFVAHKTA